MSLENKVAVVTGAGRGIGRAVALYLAGQGAKVVVNDAGVAIDGSGGDPTVADAVVKEISEAGGRAVASSDRMGSFEAGRKVIEAAMSAFGQIDLLVNNAAILRDRMIFNMSEEEWQSVIDTNLTGYFATMRAAFPFMRERKAGRVVNIISTAGLIGNVGQANYAASKGGIMSLTRVAALDMARYNVTANCIAPFAYSRVTDTIKPNTAELQAYVEGAKQAKAEHVAPLVAYLGSEAAQSVSGQLFGVRGKEIFLFSQPEVIRTAASQEEWTPETIARLVEVWLKRGLTPLQTDLDVFRAAPFVG